VPEAVRILVAEDEFSIQCFVEDALAGGGFQAEIAPSGDAAFSLFSGNRGGYRALLTDISVGAGLNAAGRSPGRSGKSNQIFRSST